MKKMVKYGFYGILKKASYFTLLKMKPSAKPSAKKLLPPKQKQKEKKLLPSAEASAFGPPLLSTLIFLGTHVAERSDLPLRIGTDKRGVIS